MGRVKVMKTRRERIPLLWSLVKERTMAKGFSFNMPECLRKTKVVWNVCKQWEGQRLREVGRGWVREEVVTDSWQFVIILAWSWTRVLNYFYLFHWHVVHHTWGEPILSKSLTTIVFSAVVCIWANDHEAMSKLGHFTKDIAENFVTWVDWKFVCSRSRDQFSQEWTGLLGNH